jgi:hypothetical protein
MSVIVEAFQQEGIPVIFAERNDKTTVIVIETLVENWDDIAMNARQTYMCEVTKFTP